MRFLAFLAAIFYLSSCTTYKQLQYLQGNLDSTKYSQFVVPEQKAQKGDQLTISVFSDNAAASAPFNTGSLSATVGGAQGSSQTASGANLGSYEVDKDGSIFFPVLGVIHVEGLTKEGMSRMLDSKLKGTYLQNPYYVIRFQNLKFTVFGEVGSPGVYPLTRNNLNIFEALTSAGDYELMLRFLLKNKIKPAYLQETIVRMRQGGKSTSSLKNRLIANREDRIAWRINELNPTIFTLILKPLRKLKQFITYE